MSAGVTRQRLGRLGRALVLGIALAGADVAAGADLELVYSGNLDGELEPCGCTELGDLGGLRRRAAMLEQLRREEPRRVLLSAGGLFDADSVTDRITNRFILRGLALMGYDAVGVQWSDLVYDPVFLAQAGLPRVASNWRGSEFARQLRLLRGQRTLRFFQWLDPADSPYRALPAATQPTDNDVAALVAAMQAARRARDLVVLATTLSPERAARELDLRPVDLLIAGAGYEQYSEPMRQGPTLVVRPGSRGQRLGLLSLTLDDAGRIASWQHRVVALPPAVPDAPSLQSWYADYSQALMDDYSQRVERRRAAAPAQSRFLGAEACAACHESAYRAWRASAHAAAFTALEAVEKAFDANCIGCHTLGFGDTGGYIDIESTPQFAQVQCESCHGAARQHVETAGQAPTGVGGRDCAGCRMDVVLSLHTASHSPAFDAKGYWARIAHGRDAKPGGGTRP